MTKSQTELGWLAPQPPADEMLAQRGRERAVEMCNKAGVELPERQYSLYAASLAAAPHLAQLVEKCPADRLRRMLEGDHEAVADAASAQLAGLLDERPDETRLMAALRQFRGQTSLNAAFGELTGQLSIEASWGLLTRAAEQGLQTAVSWLLAEAIAKNQLAEARGFVVLGLGKLGAAELNYSSDIDLICLHDPAAAGPADFFVKLTRQLVHLLSKQTGDGFGWRVDLRLRPDPGATMVSLPVEAAIGYYESLARSWERAAFIRARPLAGDIGLGAQFLTQISPFVWRKSLDFTVLEDLQGWLRHLPVPEQFHGFDVKLGAWGIRHAELLTHILQMLGGGANRVLRCHNTLDALTRLEAAGQLQPGQAEQLASCYRDWRRLEHRLQYQRDAHSHSLPRNEEEFGQFARFCGQPDANALRQLLTSLQKRTEQAARHGLLDKMLARHDGRAEQTEQLPAEPEARQVWLTGLGYQRPEAMLAIIDSWLGGRIPATRGERARAYLSGLLPQLMQEIAAAADPDAAFAAFADIIAGQSAGAQIFALLTHNPQLAGLICDILIRAPRLTDRLRRHPELMDRLLDADFFAQLPEASQLADRLASGANTGAIETALDRLRDLVRQQRFQAELHLLRGLSSMAEIEACFTCLAEQSVAIVLQLAETDMRRTHGHIDGRFAVIGLGRLGAGTMTAVSDLDLVCIYDGPAEAESHGSRPLGLGAFHMRLTQRLINWLSVTTAAGALYEVDMRLRPDGQSGPLACSWQRLQDYFDEQAWPWEKLALRRGRVIAGDTSLAQEVTSWLTHQRDQLPPLPELAADITRMRGRLADSQPAFWQMKQQPGGLLDGEFLDGLLAAEAQQEHGEKTGKPALDWQANLARQQFLQHWLRIGLTERPSAADNPLVGLPDLLAEAMASALGLPDSGALVSLLQTDRAALADLLETRLASHSGHQAADST